MGLPLVGIKLTTPTIYGWQMPIPLCHPNMCWKEDPQTELCFMLHIIFWTTIISRFNRAWLYKGLKIWDWQIIMTEWVRHYNSNPVMNGIMSSIPTRGNLIYCWLRTPWCQFCTKLSEMSDLCYLGRTPLKAIPIALTSIHGLCYMTGIMILRDTKGYTTLYSIGTQLINHAQASQRTLCLYLPPRHGRLIISTDIT